MKSIYYTGLNTSNGQEKVILNININFTKLLQKSEMRKDIVIELSYKGFG